jgi:phosphoglycolate phosphatase
MNGAPASPAFSQDVFVRCTPRPVISHVVFDFDGTLSWVRHGWPELMFETFRIHWPDPAHTLRPEWTTQMEAIVYGMNGKPSLLQMQRFASEARAAHDPESLRSHFQAALDARIQQRLGSISSGQSARDAYVVHGARPLLEYLRSLGMKLVILSSSVEHRVREEAEALGLTEYFGSHIYGSAPDPTGFSKQAVFERILASERITGENLLAFGDGPVEIECTKQLGGLAVAVCSDEEHNGSGVSHPYKFSQLLEAGADAAIPDYREAIPLVNHLLGR